MYPDSQPHIPYNINPYESTPQDWWLSPELYLRRPCELYEDYRLDRVLKRRAEAGVKVYIIVYKEVSRDLAQC